MEQIIDYLMKKMFVTLCAGIFCCPLLAQSYERTNWGVKATIETADIEVRFYSPAIVRIIKSPAGKVFNKESLSVIMQPEKAKLTLLQDGNVVQLKSDALHVSLNLLTGDVAFSRLDAHPLVAETRHAMSLHAPAQTFLLDKQEAIYGLGQQQEGVMNYRNHSVRLAQENTRVAIPFFQSVKGYGVFWDNYSATQFTDDASGTTFASEAGDAIDYYFLYGGSMDGTVACMRDLTGEVPLFPLWTWGYWQSRERYVSQKELVGTVKRYRDLKVPLDGIVQDWQYWSTDNAYWNGIEFKNPEFPQPAQMLKDIHKLNAHTIFSVWPSFGVKTAPYKVFKEKGMLLSFESFPQRDSVRVYDAFNPRARDIYWDFINKHLFSIGIDGWWLDATEAEYSNVNESQWEQPTGLGIFSTVRNAFPLQSIRGVYEHQRKVSENKRVYILTRSAFAGQQRYASTVWSGDIDGNWETFRKQIPAGLNFSLCAIPYWNTDIGGFWVRDDKAANDTYRELYVRWLEFATFSPMMRSHGTNTPREIWQFGQKGDWAYDAIEKFINLRYRLLPYNYSLAWDVTSKAGSIFRMLAMDFPKDRRVHDMSTEYMYGKSFLVVPVMHPAVKNYPVYLPKGADWYDYWTGKKHAGGTDLQQEVSIDMLPVYVRAGSIIPSGPAVQYASEKNWKSLDITVYPGADASFVLYEDEGDNYNYEKGQYSTILFTWDDATQTLAIGDRQGAFPGMLKDRVFNISILGSKEMKTIKYNGKKLKI